MVIATHDFNIEKEALDCAISLASNEVGKEIYVLELKHRVVGRIQVDVK